jgi:hypothetical protein
MTIGKMPRNDTKGKSLCLAVVPPNVSLLAKGEKTNVPQPLQFTLTPAFVILLKITFFT